MRKALEIVHQFKMAGIRFVPVPVLNDFEHDQLIKIVANKLEIMEKLCS